jgi:hypothetical protein
MQFRLTKTPLLALAAGLLITASAAAAPVYGTAASLTGSRTEGTPGLVTGGAYASDSLTQGISWEITSLGGGLWSYSYTLTNFDGAPGAGAGVSHWIVDLTDDCYRPGDPACVTGIGGPVESSEIGSYSGGPSNPGLPANIIGIKFNVADGGDATYTFTSNRAPVWGDVYFKGGRIHYAYNSGLTNHLSENIDDFIARPNGDDPNVPEPGTLMLFGAALIAGAGRMRRRR